MKQIFGNLTRAALNMKRAIYDLKLVIGVSHPEDSLPKDDILSWELENLKGIRDVLLAHNVLVDQVLEGLIERMEGGHGKK